MIFKRVLRITEDRKQSLCEGRLKHLGKVRNKWGVMEVYEVNSMAITALKILSYEKET